MQSKKVYIATDGFVAFIDRAHPKHLHAVAFFRYFAQERYQLFTTIVTINEVYMQLYNSISPSLAKDLMRALSLSAINIIYPETPDMKNALKTLLNNTTAELTFSKALMAVMCNRRSIPQIYTFEYLHSLFGLQLFYLPI